jgi:hypothetical protein
LEFAGVQIVTLSEGEITTIHVGLKGTISELFLKDLADNYRKVIGNLGEFLSQEDSRAEAHLHLSRLIEKIVLTPRASKDQLSIDLHGDLAGILKIASQENAMKMNPLNEKRLGQIAVNDNYSSEPSVMLVAGAGFGSHIHVSGPSDHPLRGRR